MTTNPPQDQSDVDALAKGLDGTLRQKAEAIATFVEGRIKPLRDDVTKLVTDQAANIKVAKDSGDPEAIKATDTATTAVKDADKAVKTAEKEPTPEKMADASDKTETAKVAVGEAKDTIEGRVLTLERDVIGLKADVDQLKEGQKSLRVVASTAHANASAFVSSIRGGVSPIRYAVLGAVSGLGLYLIYIAIVAIGQGSWGKDFSFMEFLTWGVVGGLLVGGIAFIVSGMMGSSRQTTTVSTSAAASIVAGWDHDERNRRQGTTPSRNRHNDDGLAVINGHGSSASASAEASTH